MSDQSDQRNTMTKSELIARLAEQNPHLYQRDVERIVTTIFDEIAAAAPEHRGRGRLAWRASSPG
jgi:hypothetical protein